jgi:hypothetical protein
MIEFLCCIFGGGLTLVLFVSWANHCGLRPSKAVPKKLIDALITVVALLFAKAFVILTELPTHSHVRLPIIAGILISFAGLMYVIKITALRQKQESELQSVALRGIAQTQRSTRDPLASEPPALQQPVSFRQE